VTAPLFLAPADAAPPPPPAEQAESRAPKVRHNYGLTIIRRGGQRIRPNFPTREAALAALDTLDPSRDKVATLREWDEDAGRWCQQEVWTREGGRRPPQVEE
jgi:hypothetical protein